MKRHICILPHLRRTVCGTSCTVRAAGIYLQREALKHGRSAGRLGKAQPLRRSGHLAFSSCSSTCPFLPPRWPSSCWPRARPAGHLPGASAISSETRFVSLVSCPKFPNQLIADTFCTARGQRSHAAAAETSGPILQLKISLVFLPPPSPWLSHPDGLSVAWDGWEETFTQIFD